MKNVHKLLAATTVCALALAAPAAAANMTDWDANSDAGLSNQEFRSGFESNGVFNRWDADNDGVLTENEFDSGLGDKTAAFGERFGDGDVYSEWDADSDGSLTDDEFYEGVYAGYDDDEDNIIEEPEFGDVGDDIGDGGLFDV